MKKVGPVKMSCSSDGIVERVQTTGGVALLAYLLIEERSAQPTTIASKEK